LKADPLISQGLGDHSQEKNSTALSKIHFLKAIEPDPTFFGRREAEQHQENGI
jgi:hypothetical protein